MIPIVSIVGHSGSGKTTLIEQIIPILKQKGYKVGTIKHDAHKFEIDHERKDTWRMTKAGADSVAISSSNKMALIKNLKEEKSLDELTYWLFKDMDIIITEGYKAIDKPKIEVVSNNEILTSLENNLTAIVYNTFKGVFFNLPASYKDINEFHMEDTQEIANFIEHTFIL